MLTPHEFQERLQRVEAKIVAACQRAGRLREEVALIGVTKTHPVGTCDMARLAGLLHLGENYVQEWSEKREGLLAHMPTIQWHFIGRLQSNKVKHLVGTNTLIHTVDRGSLIRALAARANVHNPVPILLQVNHAREPQKGGCTPEDLPDLVEKVLQSPSLSLRGLMSIPPAGQSPEDRRMAFQTLRETFDGIKETHPLLGDEFRELSMGMSADFETAIEEGATMVRVGTALFGSRA
jgi:pyridoxal phosphate enzyme (YggS family)